MFPKLPELIDRPVAPGDPITEEHYPRPDPARSAPHPVRLALAVRRGNPAAIARELHAVCAHDGEPWPCQAMRDWLPASDPASSRHAELRTAARAARGLEG